jgi:hypothetical protein
VSFPPCPPSPEDGNIQFPKRCVSLYLEFWTNNKVQKPSKSDRTGGNDGLQVHYKISARAAAARLSGSGGTVTDRAVYEQLERQLHSGRAGGMHDDHASAPPPAAHRNEVTAQQIPVSTAE